MVERRAIQAEFARRAEVEIQRRFPLPQAQREARQLYGRAADLTDRAKSHHDERVQKINQGRQEKPQPVPRPSFAHRLFGQHRSAQREDIKHENDRFKSRSDRIVKARENELQRLEERQHQRGGAGAEQHRSAPAEPPRDKSADQNRDNIGPQDRAAPADAPQDHQVGPEHPTDHETNEAIEADPGHDSPEHGDDTPDGADFGPSSYAGEEPMQPSWTPAERDAAINAEYEAQAELDLGYDYDPGREM